MRKKATVVGALVFAMVAVLHLMRFLFPVPIVIAGLSIPQWASAFVFVTAGALSAYLFRASRL